jgi:hypothetical protein
MFLYLRLFIGSRRHAVLGTEVAGEGDSSRAHGVFDGDWDYELYGQGTVLTPSGSPCRGRDVGGRDPLRTQRTRKRGLAAMPVLFNGREGAGPSAPQVFGCGSESALTQSLSR